MTVSLVGTVVNACDAITGFNAGNISTDDPFVQGTGAIGLKATGSSVNELYTTTISGGPYNFSSGGGQFGYHIILWLNSKSPIDSTLGFQIVVGNGTSRGRWYVTPGNYTGGFQPFVVDTARAFDIIAAGTWTLAGNPTQLSSVTQVGGAIDPTVSIMGSFNNVEIDQITIGLGVRCDGGSSGTPNTFETVRAQDQDTSIWGWWRKDLGSYVGRGKLYIGPAAGTTTSVFTDSNFSVVFSSQKVAAGFYEINTRGAGTDVTWTLGAISADNASIARWGLTIQSDTHSFSDTNGVWKGGDQLVLNSTSTLIGTSIVNCNKLTQNTAILSGISVLSANTTAGNAFILSNDLSKISSSRFTFSAGHAIEINTAGTYGFSGNIFTGYGANNTTSAAIYNNVTPATCDSYLETNQDATTSLVNTSGSNISGAGQSFTGNGGTLSACRLYLKKTGSPTGTAVAKIYAHSGVFGTSSIPTGTALATSDTFDISTLTTSYALTEFKFTGSGNITLTNTTKYVLTVEYTGGSVGNTVDVGKDTSTPTHGGNGSSFASSAWTAASGTDYCFYLYTGGAVILNITNGGGTPTYRNALGCSITINNAVTVSVTVKNSSGTAVSNARVAIYKSSDNSELTNQLTDVNGLISVSYAYTADTNIYIRVRKTSSGTTRYINNDSSGTITSTGFASTVLLLTDIIASP